MDSHSCHVSPPGGLPWLLHLSLACCAIQNTDKSLTVEVCAAASAATLLSSRHVEQVAQTRLRFGKSCSRPEYKGTFDCLRHIYETEGRPGLYRGMETKLWHSTLISALMFLSYEKIQLAVSRVVTGEAGKLAIVRGEGEQESRRAGELACVFGLTPIQGGLSDATSKRFLRLLTRVKLCS